METFTFSGGSYDSDVYMCSVSFKFEDTYKQHYCDLGFRLIKLN